MTFNAVEQSVDGGRPHFLYKFTLGDTVWRYTSGTNNYTDSDDNVYESVAIDDEGVKLTGEAVTDAVSIKAPVTIGPVQAHFITPPGKVIEVQFLRAHEGENELKVVYSGELAQVNMVAPGTALITCETLGATMRRPGLSVGWQRSCTHALYDPYTCKVDKDDFAIAARVLTVEGFTITVAVDDDLATGFYDGGFMTWVHPWRGIEHRAIEANTVNSILVFGMTGDMYPGLTMTLFPGCALNKQTCIDKFNNLPNYGGIPNLPGRSPFDGQPFFN